MSLLNELLSLVSLCPYECLFGRVALLCTVLFATWHLWFGGNALMFWFQTPEMSTLSKMTHYNTAEGLLCCQRRHLFGQGVEVMPGLVINLKALFAVFQRKTRSVLMNISPISLKKCELVFIVLRFVRACCAQIGHYIS